MSFQILAIVAASASAADSVRDPVVAWIDAEVANGTAICVESAVYRAPQPDETLVLNSADAIMSGIEVISRSHHPAHFRSVTVGPRTVLVQDSFLDDSGTRLPYAAPLDGKITLSVFSGTLPDLLDAWLAAVLVATGQPVTLLQGEPQSGYLCEVPPSGTAREVLGDILDCAGHTYVWRFSPSWMGPGYLLSLARMPDNDLILSPVTGRLEPRKPIP